MPQSDNHCYEFDIDGHHYMALQYFPENTGIPIILVHGLLLNPYFWWRDHVHKIAQATGSPIYAISLLGHAPSFFGDTDQRKIDEPFLADMIQDQVDHLIGTEKPFVLIGHSTGALASFCYALRHPKRVHALVSISTNPHGREDGGIFVFFQWLHLKLGQFGNWIFKYIVKANALSLGVHKHLLSDTAKDPGKMFAYPGFDEYLRSYLPVHKRLDHRAMGRYLTDLYQVDITDQLQDIYCPTLCLFSEFDPYIHPKMAEVFLQKLGTEHKTVHVIPNAGHLYMFEAADAFDEALLPWLEKYSSHTLSINLTRPTQSDERE